MTRFSARGLATAFFLLPIVSTFAFTVEVRPLTSPSRISLRSLPGGSAAVLKSSASDADDVCTVQILMSDTGGGHRASANALRDAFDVLHPGKIQCDIVDIYTDYGPFPYNTYVQGARVQIVPAEYVLFSSECRELPFQMSVVPTMFLVEVVCLSFSHSMNSYLLLILMSYHNDSMYSCDRLQDHGSQPMDVGRLLSFWLHRVWHVAQRITARAHLLRSLSTMPRSTLG